MSPEAAARQTGLTRERVVEAALALINEEGLEGLSMRALADRLQVKAASLYWHVRDRRELVELLAESLLDSVRPSRGADWRAAFIDAGAALSERVAGQKDASRILIEVPDSLLRSGTYEQMSSGLRSAGLPSAEASEVALMAIAKLIASPAAMEPSPLPGSVASIAIDSGSRGVLVRSGSGMHGLIRTARDRATAAPAIVRGETVVVRRLRGVGLGEIELSPAHPWRFQVQGATWNSVLEVGGIDVRAIKLDSGAAKVECFLPMPRGVVPIEVSGGVVGVTIHRPPGTPMAADISAGAVRLKLDDHSIKAAVADSRWESEEGAAAAANRYQLRISGGAVQVNVDTHVRSAPPAEPAPAAEPAGKPAGALDILLDGVESRVRSRR
ncbi:MAG TPA: TetR family transcriptional regulator [Candidatus Dormibacteraeota bacterium]